MSDNSQADNFMEAVDKGITAGGILAKERERRGLSENDAAEGLKISLSRLRALEANRWHDFASETYVRGYLHNYCRLLDIDKSRVIEAFEADRPVTETISLEVSGSREVAEVAPKRRWMRALLVLVVLAFAWGAAYWYLSQSGDSVTDAPRMQSPLESGSDESGNGESLNAEIFTESQESLDDVGVASEPLDVDPVEDEIPEEDLNDALVAADTAVESSSETDSELVVSKMTAAELVKRVQVQTEEPVEPEPVMPEGDNLVFRFTNACWIKVTDAAGDVLYTGLQRGGSELNLFGDGPFQVVVGNVEGTSIVYNGDPVDLTPSSGRKDLSLRVGN